MEIELMPRMDNSEFLRKTVCRFEENNNPTGRYLQQAVMKRWKWRRISISFS